MYLTQEDVKKVNFSKFANRDKYQLIICGPMGHFHKIGDSIPAGSAITAMQRDPRYPRVIRMISDTGKFAITRKGLNEVFSKL